MSIEQEGHVMSDTTSLGPVWHRSSFCHPSDSYCLEAAALSGGMIGVQDSKNDKGPILMFSSQVWRAFVAALKGN
ncbi:DUF397 domain-containing protein [Streptomyces milbemycinicus]|uniref:DUF397 domain-containing protein n=1 Tax=Streptomyces milbemycinicus TaxID=476552 RepID=A0ABW8LEE1_9ACTN